MYIEAYKFEPFAPVLDILGCKVDTYGVHADSDKMAKVRNWAIPRDHNEVLQFLGPVEYLACFMPMLEHSQACCRLSAATTCLLDGPHSIRNVLMK